MNDPVLVRAKRKYTRRKPVAEKPRLPQLDPLEAALETARHAQEGNHKLGRAVEALRAGLEAIAYAEVDRSTGLPATPKDLRLLAAAALDAYSQVTGQNWRRVKLTGSTRAGDRNINGTEE